MDEFVCFINRVHVNAVAYIYRILGGSEGGVRKLVFLIHGIIFYRIFEYSDAEYFR